VKYDSEVGGVVLDASKYTGDPAKLVDTALIRVENRKFPIEVYITDAQYVYRDLPADVQPGGWWGEPYFQNTIPAGVYVGKTNVWTFYNKFCYEHFDFTPWIVPETQAPDPTGDWVVDENDIYGENGDLSPEDLLGGG